MQKPPGPSFIFLPSATWPAPPRALPFPCPWPTSRSQDAVGRRAGDGSAGGLARIALAPSRGRPVSAVRLSADYPPVPWRKTIKFCVSPVEYRTRTNQKYPGPIRRRFLQIEYECFTVGSVRHDSVRTTAAAGSISIGNAVYARATTTEAGADQSTPTFRRRRIRKCCTQRPGSYMGDAPTGIRHAR